MAKNISEALNNTEVTYADLIEIANSITKDIFDPINELVHTISDRINSLSVDQIRDYILKVQLKAYEISEIKEKSAFKAEIAEFLTKEKFAEAFEGADGSAAAKDKRAFLATTEELANETLYNLIANLFKTKLDSLHRLVDALKSVLMSRMQETKFMNLGAANDPDQFKTLAQINEENSRRF